MNTKIPCTVNTVGFPYTMEVTRESLAQTLGWNPDGEKIAEILASLAAGKIVKVDTTLVPMPKGRHSLTFIFAPTVAAEAQ